MRIPLIPCVLTLLLASAPLHAQSVYKCTNPDGSVSYQDRACAGDAVEKTVTVQKPARKKLPAGSNAKLVTVPGVGQVAVLVFDYMETVVRGDGNDGVTLGLRSKVGAREKISIMMTFMKNQRGVVPDQQSHAATVRMAAQQYVGMQVGQPELLELPAVSGKGLVAVIDDPRYPDKKAPPGEYATVTVGHMFSPTMATAFTVFSDGTDNKGFEDALAIVQSFATKTSVEGELQAADTVNLPAPPSGFSWQQLPDVKGALLRPSGWYFDTESGNGDWAYFISRERNTPPDGFDTGLTVNVVADVPAKTGMTATEYAAKFIATGSGELEVIGEPFSAQRGPFVSHGALFRATDPVKGDFNAHMVAIANDKTGTVYLCIFEGPANEWDSIWKQGEAMLSKMVIDDTI